MYSDPWAERRKWAQSKIVPSRSAASTERKKVVIKDTDRAVIAASLSLASLGFLGLICDVTEKTTRGYKMQNRLPFTAPDTFRTAHFTEAQRTALKLSASSQVAVILALLNTSDKPLGASQICERLDHDWPLTSIRRALTTLLDAGLVRKNGVTLGRYGKNEFCWEVTDERDDD